ncbi:MAG: acyl-CoA dehydratase activase [Candidatus Rifleibacteriota bacterium]
MSQKQLNIGFDIGSISINTIICTTDGQIVEEMPYYRHFGRTIEVCARILQQIENKYGRENIARTAFTGTHGKTLAAELNTYFEIETTAQTKGLYNLMPEARSVVSIGGHDSALLITKPSDGGFILEDFKLNEACAAGTGSFIDQQAERIYSDFEEFNEIEDPQRRIETILTKFMEEGRSSDDPASVACRCTVFTKSDMIHLQNKGIPVKHIIAGLHDGVVKNFKSTLINNRDLLEPIAFIGGYASNGLARHSFEKILGKKVVVPNHYTSVGAYGTILSAIEKDKGQPAYAEQILSLKSSKAFKAVRTDPLKIELQPFAQCGEAVGLPDVEGKVDAYMGYDIGSTTTKLVLITPEGRIIYKRYIPTEGQPVVAIKKALKNCIDNVDVSRVNILGVGTTGSGREVANLFVGADDVVNEVTAHARGTTWFEPEVDTIFELGGQDAKYTSLGNSYVVDFRMNKVCAAGTGSFLEETANKLGIDIAGEYEDLAMAAKAPYRLTERCTVYMESDLMSYLQMGGAVEDLLAGLSQAVVHNYLNRVVQDGKIGRKISFQGGPSLNKSVVAAFERIVGKPIITLPHREVMGAIGSAMHAMDEIKRKKEKGIEFITRFRGWDVIDKPFIHEEEICTRNPDCHNQCKLQIYRVGNDEAIYGGDCGMYESRQQAEKRTPDFNRVRQQLYFKHVDGLYREIGQPRKEENKDKKVIGIPRALGFHQIGIFWIHLLNEMGFEVIISPETNTEIVDKGISAMTCESCFPVKISHGHAATLKDHCDYLFMPMMIEMESSQENNGFYCPYVEANSYMLMSALGLDINKIIKPPIHFKKSRDEMTMAFSDEFSRLGFPFEQKQFEKAYDKAMSVLNDFNKEIKKVGAQVLKNLGDQRAIVVVGRPYSAYDSRTNLNLFATFSRLGIHAIPQEFLELEDINVESEYPNMYWGFGNKILQAAKYINRDPRLFGLYLTSFSCGPDSFVLHFFNHEMSRTNRPYLELELDEHSAGAGVETRLLAFIDAIKNQQKVTILSEKDINFVPRKSTAPLTERTLYLPFMAEGARCLAASFRAVGCDAKVMPTYSKAGLEFGKKHTSGKECFPCIVTTGDMFDVIDKHRAQQENVNESLAFFMPETEGPCRFGQYTRLHRILLDKYKYVDVPILSPSSEDSYRFSGYFNDDQAVQFRQLAWQAVVYSDLIEKALWKIRPYEKVKGTTDKVFEEAMKNGVAAIEAGGGLKMLKVAKQAARAFKRIERHNVKKPLIGIVGEIFVRTHKESNQQLVKALEDLGCETYTSSVAEWVEYTTHTGIEDSRNALRMSKSLNNFGELTKFWLTSKYQRMVAKFIGRPFKNILENRFDHSTDTILKEVDGIFSNHINGEAILSIGGAMAFADEGYNGIVNAMPFTCMPSTIASSILKVQMRNKAPYVDMIYDGTILPNRETNLATFVFQAQQNLEKNGRKG